MQARRNRRRQPAQRGFTLIELMVTVAVIAILARIAIPSYLNYIKRGKLTEAFSQMAAVGMQASQYYQDNRNYTSMTVTPTTPNFAYTFTPRNSGANYTLTATGSTNATNGFTFTLDDASVHQTTSAPAGWQTSTTCWISSQAGTCQ